MTSRSKSTNLTGFYEVFGAHLIIISFERLKTIKKFVELVEANGGGFEDAFE